MTTTALVTSSSPVVTLQPKEYHYTPDQIALISRTVAPGLSQDEFALFLYVAKVRNLDPLQRQIHAVKRKTWDTDTNGYVERMTLQTGIDGYRAIANRTGLYMPSDKLPALEGVGAKDMRVTVWVKKWSPRDSQWHEYGATAYYREFVQVKKSGQETKPNSMWDKMPVNQLTKCAEALALRKGWPEELGGIYADEEMQHQGDVIPPTTPTKQDKTQREVGTLKASSEPNRGHGKEGMAVAQPKSETWICNECRETNRHLPTCSQFPEWRKSRDAGKDAGAANPSPAQPHAEATASNPLLVQVKGVKPLTKRGSTQVYLVVSVLDVEGNEWDFSAWDTKHHPYLNEAVNKNCVLTFTETQKGERKFYNLQHILEIGGVKFVDDKPADQGTTESDPW